MVTVLEDFCWHSNNNQDCCWNSHFRRTLSSGVSTLPQSSSTSVTDNQSRNVRLACYNI
ncbi:hypothetical protein PHET_04472 [Paragonimus heterotremus]|uniref:Uncharacterized protein n=1 Tax=Paragonimus heterotremus TaxID=100268 RepID=A0A8J4SQ72_9TREM|nr:hypothetical protein PHET_04472 [Paragonimus heterotremus]